MTQDDHFMELALTEARRAGERQDVPVGAVLVAADGTTVLAADGNRIVERRDPTAHAEIEVIRQAAARLGNERLVGTTLYVTLEPCAMCAGAIQHARIERVVFGARDPKTGACGSVVDLFSEERLNHHAAVTGGVLAEECGLQLSTFFAGRRRATRAAGGDRAASAEGADDGAR